MMELFSSYQDKLGDTVREEDQVRFQHIQKHVTNLATDFAEQEAIHDTIENALN